MYSSSRSRNMLGLILILLSGCQTTANIDAVVANSLSNENNRLIFQAGCNLLKNSGNPSAVCDKAVAIGLITYFPTTVTNDG